MINRPRFISGAVLATLCGAVAACAPVTPPPGAVASLPAGQCFFASTITGFKEAGGGVNVRAGTSDVYRVAFASRCDGLSGADRVLLDSRAGGASVCAGLDVDLILATASGPRRCPGQAIRKLSPAEVAALPAAERPGGEAATSTARPAPRAG